MKTYRPVVLVVLDGWGESKEKNGNAIANAKLPTIEKMNQVYPKILLQASGISVGLPWGECGNSEVGHQTMGCGQIIYQNLPRISMSIEDGSFFKNQIFAGIMDDIKKKKSKLHLIGLVSDGGVHSHIDHLLAILEIAKQQEVQNVFVHVFTDGRDTSPKSAEIYIQKLEKKMKSLEIGQIATVMGRFYAMDRNENWDRTQKAYDAMTLGNGILEKNPLEGIKKQYSKKIFDENLEPMVMTKDEKPVATIDDGDGVIFFNYREDRARQIMKAFCEDEFKEFRLEKRLDGIKFVSMVEYEKGLGEYIAFPPQKISITLGKVLSEEGKKQLRIAETEKYAHVTYFFNAGEEKPFKGEDHILVPSKKTDSYAKIPEMSAKEITEKLIDAVENEKYDFILVNYANPDMVGHTGEMKPSIQALETVDGCLEELIESVLEKNGCLLITADHGNVEEVINLRTGERDTEHSANPVPCWLVTPENQREKKKSDLDDLTARGFLSDIAPTILDLMGIKKPKEMTGDSLLEVLE